MILLCEPRLNIRTFYFAPFNLLATIHDLLCKSYVLPDIGICKPWRWGLVRQLIGIVAKVNPNICINIKVKKSFQFQLWWYNSLVGYPTIQLHVQHPVVHLIILLDSCHNARFMVLNCLLCMVLSLLVCKNQNVDYTSWIIGTYLAFNSDMQDQDLPTQIFMLGDIVSPSNLSVWSALLGCKMHQSESVCVSVSQVQQRRPGWALASRNVQDGETHILNAWPSSSVCWGKQRQFKCALPKIPKYAFNYDYCLASLHAVAQRLVMYLCLVSVSENSITPQSPDYATLIT